MECEMGIIGLGVMGRNLLLNMADHGFNVVGFDRDQSKVDSLLQEAEKTKVHGARDINEFILSLKKPRNVLLLVPAGAPVDAVIQKLIPLLSEGDIIIDAGNSYYKDTDLRAKQLQSHGIQLLGVGISGGEEGARKGPSMMPGGRREDYERVRSIFEAVAAKVNGDPCVAYLGPGSAGHFVKMVHNGIEYGIMQLIAESYDLMKRGLGLNDDALHDVYAAWDNSELKSYLIEITSNIFQTKDQKTGKKLVDEILDVASQNGTGMWTSQAAMELQVPIPTIDLAVGMRNLSVIEEQRKKASQLLNRPIKQLQSDSKEFVKHLQQALYASMIMVYAQGMALLSIASEKLKYQFDMESIARIWRGGCIIRAALLEDIRVAYKKDPKLPNLLLDPELAKRVMKIQEDLRWIVCQASTLGIAAPAFMTSLSYFDGFRSAWLPANLIEAQRDYFGSHSYERIDAKGTFHTEWAKDKAGVS